MQKIYVACLLIMSLIFYSISIIYFYQHNKFVTEYILLFPGANYNSFYQERRYMPKRDTIGESIKDIVDELLLGSSNIQYTQLFPQGATVRVLYYDAETNEVYIDFSQSIINVEMLKYNVLTTLELVKKNIIRNYAHIKKVIFFIEGEEIVVE